jgi:hypothetical protein
MGMYPASDGSLNGSVDGADLTIWKEQHGRIVEFPDDPPFATIPEPESAVMITVAAAVLYCLGNILLPSPHGRGAGGEGSAPTDR